MFMMQADSISRPGNAALFAQSRPSSRFRARFALERLIAAAVALMLVLMTPAPSHAQSYAAPADTEASPVEFLPQGELDALLAPIALYPDDLLAQVLMASTYPLEVVEAARFVQQNPGLTSAALDDVLRGKRWDPSVQSLAAFPQVLAMMSDRLEWTQQLGDAFLANRQQVMDTVQALRSRAEAVGTLSNSDQERVYTEDQTIVIEPTQPDYVYVPVYDPQLVYGPWWVGAYQPIVWYPPAFYGYPLRIGAGIAWSRPCHVDRNHWGWAHADWHTGSIRVTAGHNGFFNRPQYRNYARGNVPWQHVPEHRHGVAYGSTVVRDRYADVERRAEEARREVRAATPSAAPARQVAPPLAPVPAPQGATTVYRQVSADPRGVPALRAAPSVVTPAPPAMSQPQALPVQRAAPSPSLPRAIVAAPQVAPVPSLPRVVIAAPQVAPAPPPAYVPVPVERGRVIRQGVVPAPADAGDSSAPRAR
jgi:hypothetical protein